MNTPATIMGILNVTPDSFSDGGKYRGVEAAVGRAHAMINEGAQIIDIGGESTRPGAAPVGVAEECDRILPVLHALRGCGAILSVDTRNAATMRAALDAGAGFINDVTALTYDPEAMRVAAGSHVPVCLMHMQGSPQTMQQAPAYHDVVAEVRAYLAVRIADCVQAGISKDRLFVDPGIGFGKTPAHNTALLRHIDALADLGVPVLLGVSRKSFIAACDRDVPATERLGGSLAAVIAAYRRGVRYFRVHDVAETRQALALTTAIENYT